MLRLGIWCLPFCNAAIIVVTPPENKLISKTETKINTRRVVCVVAGLTKCQQERQQSLGWRGRPAPGVFVPECDTNGEYKSTQCHESSGLCWCVDAGGNEVPRTRIRGRAICRPSGKLSEINIFISPKTICILSISSDFLS